MEKSIEEIEYLILEEMLYFLDEDSLEMSCNRMYDESDRNKTFVDTGETMGFYGVNNKISEEIKSSIASSLEIDISDLYLENTTISKICEIAYNRYKTRKNGNK
jgi:hypothetical protein